MPYIIYGKRPGDRKFKALDGKGIQVKHLADSMVYAEKSDAQDILNKYGKDDCQFDIRPVPRERKRK